MMIRSYHQFTPLGLATCGIGMILVNLESRRVVDLLTDREAATAAAWMRRQFYQQLITF